MLTSKRDAAKYKGPAADLWSSAVILFVMLSGAYPFEDARDPRNMKKTVEVRIISASTTAMGRELHHSPPHSPVTS